MPDENMPDGAGLPVDGAEQRQETEKINPSWTEAWGDFTPEPVKEAQKAVFEKWDRNYREVESKLAPFKPFLDQGLTPEIVAQAIQLQERIADNPRDFYDRMGQHWGYSQEIQAAQRAAAANPSGEGEELSPAEQRLQELIQRQEQLLGVQEQTYQQSISRQNEAAQVQQINSELDAIEAKEGKFDRDRVLKQAIMNAQSGGNPSLTNAFYEVQRERDEWLASQQKQAPRVLGSGGAIGQQPTDPKKIPTREEQRAQAMDIARQLAGGF